MDIYDINQKFDISLRKLRRMEKAGVLRTGKSQVPHHWQMVRSDIRKGKMSARSVALAYRYPDELARIFEMNRSQRHIIEQHIQQANLPSVVPSPVESTPAISTIICGAVTHDAYWMERFIGLLKLHVPAKSVEHLYIAVRILLMCQSANEIVGASAYLTRAMLKARDCPTLDGWWHREATGEQKGYHIVYHKPAIDFDL
jgi:hypothetical protein